MADLVITGATRGIGKALALALPTSERLVVIGRNAVAIGHVVRELAQQGKAAEAVVGNLSSLAAARALGDKLVKATRPGATLVHNAGVWPSSLQINEDGLESSFVVNCLAPLALQEPLLAAKRVKRIVVIGALLMLKGRFDAEVTPFGKRYSSVKTYADTKLAMAVAMRDVAEAYPDVEVLVVHPGVVRTDLGGRGGFVGWLLGLVKKGWEDPQVTGERLARILARERFAPPGEALWMNRETIAPWPAIADEVRGAVRAAVVSASRLPSP